MSNDTLYGGAGDDIIYGGPGNDSVFGEEGNDTLYGQSGSDTLIGGVGADLLDGGSNFDFASYQGATEGAVASLRSGRAEGAAAGDRFVGIEGFVGSDFDDIFAGNASNNRFVGGDGDDLLIGDAGNDTLIGGLGADSMFGDAGFDVLDYRAATSAAIFSLRTGRAEGFAAGDRFSDIEAIAGTRFGDEIAGDDRANAINGEQGNDILVGYAGNDTLTGGAGADSLFGGAGFDAADYTRESRGVVASLRTGRTEGAAAGDRYDSIEAFRGTNFDDTFAGDAANNFIDGRNGNDLLIGDGGNDTLVGGLGNDSMYGETGYDTVSYASAGGGAIASLRTGRAEGAAAGDRFFSIEGFEGSNFADTFAGNAASNTLDGRGGNDILIGDAGGDVFVFKVGYDADRITDFDVSSGDRVRISGFGSRADSFADIQGLARDVDGSTVIDFGGGDSLTLDGVRSADLAADDFVFV